MAYVDLRSWLAYFFHLNQGVSRLHARAALRRMSPTEMLLLKASKQTSQFLADRTNDTSAYEQSLSLMNCLSPSSSLCLSVRNVLWLNETMRPKAKVTIDSLQKD